jgi:hypothetical protein
MGLKLMTATGSSPDAGKLRLTGDSDAASSANTGAMRYRTEAGKSFVEVVMQTGAASYAWVALVSMEW